ncbi:MAG: hypothetical protein WCL50_05490 [Spirochaetota bacterium]
MGFGNANGTTSGGSNNGGTTGILAADSWWGPWARLDRVETWYIAADHLVEPAASVWAQTALQAWTGASSSRLTTASTSLELVAASTDLAKVTRGGAVFYVHRSARAGASFTGTAVSQTGATKGLPFGTALSNVALVVRNVKNYAEEHLVQTLADGSFTIVNAIKGDLYEVLPKVTGATPVIVQAAEDGIDVGVVTVAAVSYNFKVSALRRDNPWVFAGSQPQYITLTITNVGAVRSLAPTYTLSSSDPRLVIGGTLVNNLATFEPGTSQTLTLPVTVSSVTGGYEDLAIGVKLEIYNGPTWEDRASLRFYKDDKLQVSYQNVAGHANLLTPNGDMFSLGNAVISITRSIIVPRADTGYSIILSGATATSETKYALWIGSETAFNPDLTAYVSQGSYEPNDDAAHATGLYANASAPIVSYLMVDDMDWYAIH